MSAWRRATLLRRLAEAWDARPPSQPVIAAGSTGTVPAAADVLAAVARAQEWALEQGVDELMLIGGAQLYSQGLAHADRLYLTRVALSPEGDAWFPEFDAAQWKLVSDTPNAAQDGKPAYSFEVWEKA